MHGDRGDPDVGVDVGALGRFTPIEIMLAEGAVSDTLARYAAGLQSGRGARR